LNFELDSPGSSGCAAYPEESTPSHNLGLTTRHDNSWCGIIPIDDPSAFDKRQSQGLNVQEHSTILVSPGS